jgi:hypothetical protein
VGDGGDYEAIAADAIKDGIRSAADDELPDAGLRPEVSASFASQRLVAGLRRADFEVTEWTCVLAVWGRRSETVRSPRAVVFPNSLTRV